MEYWGLKADDGLILNPDPSQMEGQVHEFTFQHGAD